MEKISIFWEKKLFPACAARPLRGSPIHSGRGGGRGSLTQNRVTLKRGEKVVNPSPNKRRDKRVGCGTTMACVVTPIPTFVQTPLCDSPSTHLGACATKKKMTGPTLPPPNGVCVWGGGFGRGGDGICPITPQEEIMGTLLPKHETRWSVHTKHSSGLL